MRYNLVLRRSLPETLKSWREMLGKSVWIIYTYVNFTVSVFGVSVIDKKQTNKKNYTHQKQKETKTLKKRNLA